ncbi:related to GNAT family acetyltransferase [Rhynchosporium agropyri]|uniref:Related to GNAT family acetyltransferase n=3 Tax=Rhynchosporium TaxID=38037 RepID=A0A1E1M8V7_RHYSE|nr:related to GNAT family acetyltransferase [Rhynchosporium commune]CZS89318.1 related to GNAT family acetyltransferase [Rhynchosporium agropyri]CZT45530.1 related to GNAT family acetyltransferase [Rhynchosporium secalis]
MDSLTILAMAAEAVQRSESLELEREREFTIRRPRTSDIPLLAQVEHSAAQIYRTAGMDSLADGATLDPYILITIANAGYLLIAANRFDEPIGFLGGNYLSGNFHIIELSVAREYQGRGIGSALVTTMSQQVRLEGYRSITLTTFKDLPWNAPWYAKLGFEEVKAQDMGKEFEKLVDSEARHGLDPKRRCVMRMVF